MMSFMFFSRNDIANLLAGLAVESFGKRGAGTAGLDLIMTVL